MPLHTVSFLVENKPGVLFKVSNLFRRRGYNITSLTVGPVEGSPLSRMTVVVDAESRVLNQIVEQLDKMVDVVKVKRLDPIRTLSRELLLIKLKTSDPMARIEAVNTVNAYHGLILDVEPDILIASRANEFYRMTWLRRFWNRLGVKAVARLCHADITDSQSGFRLIRTEIVKGISLTTTGFEMELELLIKACKSGFGVLSIPINVTRVDGTSSSHFRPVTDTWLVCKLFLRSLFW